MPEPARTVLPAGLVLRGTRPGTPTSARPAENAPEPAPLSSYRSQQPLTRQRQSGPAAARPAPYSPPLARAQSRRAEFPALERTALSCPAVAGRHQNRTVEIISEKGLRRAGAAAPRLRGRLRADEASEPADEDDGLARVLVPREVGRGSHRVGDRDRRCPQVASVGIGPPATGRSASARRLPLPRRSGPGARPGRRSRRSPPPVERRAPGSISARSRRADASGSPGSRISSPVRRVGLVHARVGAHEPVMGLADEHALVRAHELDGLVEHRLDQARVLAVLGAERRGRSPASISSRRRTRPSAFETTLCATTSTSRARVARRGIREQAPEVVPRTDIGQPREGVEDQRLGCGGHGSGKARRRSSRPARPGSAKLASGRAGAGLREWRGPGRAAFRGSP